jgi:uncharacterized membrane protein YfcA
MDFYGIHLLNLAIGIFIGCYGTLVGAGGGFLLVPYFLLMLKMPHEAAVGTSLAIVSANALSGALGYVFRRIIDYRAGVVFAVCTVPGAVLGAYLIQYVSGPIFMRGFGVFLACMSVYLFLRKPRKEGHGELKQGRFMVQRHLKTDQGEERYSYNELIGAISSVFVGMFSSLLGIGGGVIHVPLMTEVLRLPVHVAVATSHFILAWTALAGAISHGVEGHLRYDVVISAGIGAIIGAQIGVRLSHKLKGSILIRYLSIGMFAVALRLIFI